MFIPIRLSLQIKQHWILYNICFSSKSLIQSIALLNWSLLDRGLPLEYFQYPYQVVFVLLITRYLFLLFRLMQSSFDSLGAGFSVKTYELISTAEKSVVNKHCNDIATKFAVGITESQEKPPTFYWLPKLHKQPYKARFIATSSSCTTTSLS